MVAALPVPFYAGHDCQREADTLDSLQWLGEVRALHADAVIRDRIFMGNCGCCASCLSVRRDNVAHDLSSTHQFEAVMSIEIQWFALAYKVEGCLTCMLTEPSPVPNW